MRKYIGGYTYIDIEDDSVVVLNADERYRFTRSNYVGVKTLEDDIKTFLEAHTRNVHITPNIERGILTWTIELSYGGKVFYTDTSSHNICIAEVESLMWLVYEYTQYKGE